MPGGSQRSTYSAPILAMARLFRVRLSVATIITPPGATSLAVSRRYWPGSATCSITSMFRTMSNRSPPSARASAVPQR